MSLSEDTVKRIGYFLGKYLLEQHPKGAKVCIGYDVREHSPQMCAWLSSGFNALNAQDSDNNIEVYQMGMSATPVNYFANYAHQVDSAYPAFDATVMITASHNPKNYNGFKITIDKKPFFGGDLQRLKDEIKASLPTALAIADDNAHKYVDVNSLYIDYITQKFAHLKESPIRLLADSGNGSAGFIIDEIFKNLSLAYNHLYKEPDGTFPHHHPDPSEEHNLQDIKQHIKGYDIAFAYDGDGDRLATLTKTHNIKGDILATIFAKQMTNPTVIAEVKSSLIFYQEVNAIGKAIMCKTGHSHIKEKIRETNATFGAEVSGHIFFNDDYFGYDDAIYSTFRVLELLHRGIDLDDEIAQLPKLISTPELKMAVAEERKFEIMQKIEAFLKTYPKDFPKNFPAITNITTIDGVRIEFAKGWALIRASNTSPYLITRFEAVDEESLELYQSAMEKMINDHLL